MMYVESCTRPIAVGAPIPYFSWQLPHATRGHRQTAYHIAVTDAQANQAVWDSGRVESSQSIHIPYAGEPLESNRDYTWTLQLWDEARKPMPPSRPEPFSTTLLKPDDWSAKWIGMGDPKEPYPDPAVYQQNRVPPEVKAFEPNPRAPMLRRDFELGQPIRRARAFVCGVGLFELHLNGQKVGDDVLPTPRTDFRKRVLFSTYDITRQLREGGNAIAIVLGNGWFNGQKSYWGWQYQWYGSPRTIVQVEIEFEDGSTERIVSDELWRGAPSPIMSNCIYDGETYDAREELPGWNQPGFDTSAWTAVNVVPAPGERLEPLNCDPERITEVIRPVAVVQPEPGVYVYNVGKNITGWVRLKLHNTKRGEIVQLRFGEAMHDDGRLNNSSNNRAKQTDHYICKGDEEETWEPRFLFHGFQYVELSGYSGTVDLDTIEARFVRTAVAQTGKFACGNELINNIHRCTAQSLLCNVQMGVPTDDTQRPERLGWGADAWGCANAAIYNMGMARLYEKWLGDFRDQQDESGFIGMIAPQAGSEEDIVWTAAFPLIAWWAYTAYGDKRFLSDNYAALQRYMGFLQRIGTEDVQTVGGDDVINRLMWRCGGLEKRLPELDERGHLQVCQWGDHLSTADSFQGRTGTPLSVATAFYYLDAVTMANIAEALDHSHDAAQYRELARQINVAFHERFFDAALHRYDDGTQAAQAWPLAFGMVAEEALKRVQGMFIRNVASVQRHLTTGYVGTKYAIQALADADRHDVIWMLATSTTYPSWGYMLKNKRTTSCERWDGEGGSLNHAPLGAAIDEWFYWGLAGIRPDPTAPGFNTIVFKPYLPKGLPWAQASIRTLSGTISSAWKRGDDMVTLDITVPANCKGVVHIPFGDSQQIMEGDAVVGLADEVTLLTDGNPTTDEQLSIYRVDSGTYRFSFPLS